MGALRASQYLYDNAEPAPGDGQDEAVRIWVDDGVAELMARRDYLFQYRGKQIGVTYDRFAKAVDEHAMSELGRPGISESVLGRLMLAGHFKIPTDTAAAVDEIMNCASPRAVFEQLARDLLAPLAQDGVQAQREDEP